MKRMLAVLLTAVMALSMTACGGGSSSGTAGGSGDGGASASGDAAGKVKISFINSFTGGDGPFMSKIVDGFNESQDTYYVEQLQDADHYTKFKADPDNFDMLIIHADWISTYHALGLLRDVSDIYEKAGVSFENDFHPITQTYAKYDDGVFAFPLDLYAETYYYNKELTGDEAPADYDDMIALRDKLDSENSNIYPIALPLTGDHQWGWMTALGQSGCSWVEGKHIKMDTEEVCDAFMKIHDLIYKDHLSPAGLGAEDHFNCFVAEGGSGVAQSAMMLSGPWKYTTSQEVLGDNLGIGTLPQIYGDTPCVPAGGHTFAVSSQVTDQAVLDGIAAFMAYVYNPDDDVLLNWADSGQAPIHLATMEKVQAQPDVYPVAAVNYTIFDDAMILPAIYNIREQVKYVNETVWAAVLQTEDLSRDDLMAMLQEATTIATELSEL